MSKRIEDLEVKVAFLESAHEELSDVLREVADTMAQLRQDLKDLRDHVDVEGVAEAGTHEKPPHHQESLS